MTLVLAAGGFLWFVHRYATDQAERAVNFHAAFVADTILRESLRKSDFRRPVAPARLAALDALFHDEVLVGGALRVKVYRPDGLVTYSNAHDLIGTRPGDEDIAHALGGERVIDVTSLNHEGGPGPDLKVLETYVPVRVGGGRPAGVFELYQDYGPVAAATRKAFVPIAVGLAVGLLLLFATLVPILRRVTRRLQQHVEEIEYQALHDHLTDLPNRVLFRDRVEQALKSGDRDGNGFAVFILDLDHFKDVNDTLGHESGDLVLEEVARRLREAVRTSDTVARLGGDEFAVLAADVGALDAAVVAAQKVRSALARPITVAEVLVDVDTSVGIALAPHHGSDVETLIRRADIAMYVAKERRTGAELYTADYDRHSPDRLQLVAELRHAIADREIVCYYQPLATFGTGVVHAVEALVRWPHPTRGLLGPDEFIPIAERTGLIRDLTRHVLHEAIGQCSAWRERGLELSVSVNVTGRDLLDAGLPDEVASLLAEAQVEPRFLVLEITENTILADPVRARAILVRLSDLGVRLAIDDFGSGNSSLGYLKRLPVQVLKIDKSFVLNMERDEDDATIVRSTINLGHNLGLEVVAEGIESSDVWERLATFGCDVGQGFWLGRPAPAGALALEPPGARRQALAS